METVAEVCYIVYADTIVNTTWLLCVCNWSQ